MSKKAFEKIEAGLKDALEMAEQTPIKGEDWKMEMSPEVQAQVDADPELAAMMREMFAQLRQALDGATGPEDVEARMEAMGAKRIELDDLDDEEDDD
jgi:hypothetical protein